MQGRCLSCNRTYEISDDFLSMGGKAKCPHCLQALSFQDEHAKTVVQDPTELKSRSYGELDPPKEPSVKTKTIITDHIGQNVVKVNDPYSGTDEFELPELNELQSEQDMSDSADSDHDFSGVPTDPFGDGDRIKTQADKQDPSPESQSAADANFFDDETRKVDSLQLPDAENLARSLGLESDTEDGSPQTDESSEEEPASDAEEQYDSEEEPASESGEQLESDEDLSLSKFEEDLSLGDNRSDSEESFDSGLYDSSEVSQDSIQASGNWALAAEEWAKGGFKAEEMPDFMSKQRQSKTASQEIEPDRMDEDRTQADPKFGQTDVLKKSKGIFASAADSVSVSEQDVIGLSDQEKKVAQDSLRKQDKQVSKDPLQKLNTEKIRSRQRPDAPVAKLLSRPRLLAIALLIIVFFLWLFFRKENIASFEFPMQGIAASQVESPEPRQYEAKENAIKHYAMGNREAHIGKFEKAIKEYQQSIQLDPSYPLPHRALGSIYAALGKASLSISFYESYVRLAPDSPDAMSVKSIISTYNSSK